MRDCQPGPAWRKNSSTSASRRSVTCFFGASAFGRPRPLRKPSVTSGNSSAKGLACLKSASVHSGLSLTASQSLLAKPRPSLSSVRLVVGIEQAPFCLARRPHADDGQPFPAEQGKDHHDSP